MAVCVGPARRSFSGSRQRQNQEGPIAADGAFKASLIELSCN